MPLPGELAELADRVRNWGRWGDDDELGTANLLDDAAARRGAAAVRSGRRVALAVDLKRDGVQIGQPAGRYNPIISFTAINERDPFAPGIWEGTDEILTMSTCAGTHIDALSHVSYDDQLYNGYPTSSTSAFAGATVLGAEKLVPIVTRGILLDLPRLKGVDGLDEVSPGYAVTGEDLDAAADAAGVATRIEPVPSWPCVLDPNANASPPSATTSECDLPPAAATIFLFAKRSLTTSEGTLRCLRSPWPS